MRLPVVPCDFLVDTFHEHAVVIPITSIARTFTRSELRPHPSQWVRGTTKHPGFMIGHEEAKDLVAFLRQGEFEVHLR